MRAFLSAAFSLILLLALFPAAGRSAEIFEKEFAGGEATGTLVVERLSDGKRWEHNGKRAELKMIPASTFKIVSSLIALELGVASNVDELQPWDGQTRRIQSWNKPQSLREAFANSTVPVYQSIARKIGRERMQSAVTTLGYGNTEIGNKVDDFWLVGPLRISANEQIAFLKRLYGKTLPISRLAQEATIEIMEVSVTESYIERGKTGWEIASDPAVGWYVGWFELQQDVVFFALNMDMTRPFHRTARKGIVRQALHRIGLVR